MPLTVTTITEVRTPPSGTNYDARKFITTFMTTNEIK